MPEEELGLRGWLSGGKSRKSKTPSEKTRDLDPLRLAVLPMANMSPDPNDSYFADGITEEIISTLSSVKGLTVISRTSVTGYKGTTKKVREIGQELDVGSVLEGSFRKAGKKIRVTTQLIDVADDRHLWTQSYDRELDDVFAVQTDIARQVADALKVRILPEEKQRLEKPPTKSIEAYSLYLKGRFWWNKRTEEGSTKSISYFEEAAALDPAFPLAYIGIADAYNVLVGNGFMKQSEGLPKAEQNLAKALKLDSQLAEAHATLGLIYRHRWEWSKAEAEFKTAIGLNPSYASAHHWYSNLLMYLGRLNEALTEAKNARRLDPLSLIILGAEAATYHWLRDYPRAIALYREALEMDPNFAAALSGLTTAYMETSQAEAIMALWPKLQEVAGEGTSPFPRYRASWASLYAWLGKRAEAQAMLDAAESSRDKTYVSPVDIAIAHLYLGEKDQAFEWLETAYNEKSSGLAGLKGDPLFDPIRSDPRYTRLLEKIGLGNQSVRID